MENEEENLITIECSKTKMENNDRSEKFFKKIRGFERNCNRKNFKGILALTNEHFEVDHVKFARSQVYRRQLLEQYTGSEIDKIYQQFKDECMVDDIFFLSAAKFDLEELENTIRKFGGSKEKINQTRNEDNIILFLLKYSNISQNQEAFISCVSLLINEGVDVKKYDMKGKTALDYICIISKDYNSEKLDAPAVLKQLTELCLHQGVYEITDKQTKEYLKKYMESLESNAYKTLDTWTQLYLLIIKHNHEEFKKCSLDRTILNQTNCEYTLLQLACHISDNNINLVEKLLASGADPNLTTERKNETPLEIAGRKNHSKIFKLLLSNKETKVTEQQYNTFIQIRSAPMKCNLFEMLLLSDKLNVDYKSETKQNLPIHYAISFNHKQAIAKLLKRGSSWYEKNAVGKCTLDIIESDDLKKYFDTRIKRDYFNMHKLNINISSLINSEEKQELYVVNEIAANRRLRELILHPLVHFLLSLKWVKCHKSFYFTVLLQAILFVLMSLYFYYIHKMCLFLGFLVVLLNLSKLLILFNCENKNGSISLPAFKRVPFHALIELIVITTSLLILILELGSLSSCQRQLRAFIFVEMAIAFLLTCGYHPKLSKWSLMLQRVFKTFSLLFIFFSLIVFGFSAGFHILFEDDEEQQLFKNFFTSILKTYIMTTAEFDINGVDFSSSGIGGYLLFGIFAMTMSLVIVNFWTGVAVTDIERIQKDSELNAFKNVMVFLDFIDIICSKKIFKRSLGESYLFQEKPHGEYTSVPKIEKRINVGFFLNKDIQIDEKDYPKLPRSIDNICLEKLKSHCSEQVVPQEEIIAEILEKLKKLEAVNTKVETLKSKLEIVLRKQDEIINKCIFQ